MNEGTTKSIKYKLMFAGNLLRYFCKKVKLPFLEVWVGQRCNLKCSNCSHLIPYTEPIVYDIKKLISDCEHIFSLCNIGYLSVLGGEPFINEDISELIDFIANCESISAGSIVTNGTIIPDNRTLTSLINLKGKLQVEINEYPGTVAKAETFYNLMLSHGVRCHINRFNSNQKSSWKMLSSPVQNKQELIMTETLFRSCQNRYCCTLADGEFTSCPRGITSESVYNVPKNKYENIDLRTKNLKLICKAHIATAVSKNTYKDYCRYCLSLSDLNPYYVSPGMQLTDELLEKIGVMLK